MARAHQPKRPSSSGQFTGSPSAVAAQIRAALNGGGSTEHAAGVQQYFKQEIKSHGWYTADLRRAVRACRREILAQQEFNFLVSVADELFSGTYPRGKKSRGGISPRNNGCAIRRLRIRNVPRIVDWPHQQLGGS